MDIIVYTYQEKTLFRARGIIITILMQPFDSVPSRARQIEMVIYGDKFDRGEIGSTTNHFAAWEG